MRRAVTDAIKRKSGIRSEAGGCSGLARREGADGMKAYLKLKTSQAAIHAAVCR